MGVKAPLVAFEVFLDQLPKPKNKAGQARPLVKLSNFQPVARDFAFVVDTSIEAAQILRAAQSADKNLISQVRVFDVFAGGNLGEGKKSVAIEVILQPFEQTLTDDTIEAVSAKVVAAVAKATGGELRG
jgi:phenylalanyl-tRNA synthetase beta chain